MWVYGSLKYIDEWLDWLVMNDKYTFTDDILPWSNIWGYYKCKIYSKINVFHRLFIWI